MRQVKRTEKGFTISVDIYVLDEIKEGLKDRYFWMRPEAKEKARKLINDICHAEGLGEPF